MNKTVIDLGGIYTDIPPPVAMPRSSESLTMQSLDKQYTKIMKAQSHIQYHNSQTLLTRSLTHGDRSLDNVKFPDGLRHSAC